MHRVRFYSLIILAVAATSTLAQMPAGPHPDGFAGLPVTLWISKSSRRLVRQIMHISPTVEIMFVAPYVGSSSA